MTRPARRLNHSSAGLDQLSSAPGPSVAVEQLRAVAARHKGKKKPLNERAKTSSTRRRARPGMPDILERLPEVDE